MTHYLLTPTGKKDAPAPENGTNYSLGELYSIIGCEYIQVIRIGDKLMIFDEEAKIKGITERNEDATEIAHKAGVIFGNDYFVGNVFVCDKKLFR